LFEQVEEKSRTAKRVLDFFQVWLSSLISSVLSRLGGLHNILRLRGHKANHQPREHKGEVNGKILREQVPGLKK